MKMGASPTVTPICPTWTRAAAGAAVGGALAAGADAGAAGDAAPRGAAPGGGAAAGALGAAVQLASSARSSRAVRIRVGGPAIMGGLQKWRHEWCRLREQDRPAAGRRARQRGRRAARGRARARRLVPLPARP